MRHSLLLLSFCALACLGCDGTTTPLPSSPEVDHSPPSRVTALGRLEPGWGVVDVGVPIGDRIARLEVTEGDAVTAEQLLAVLESHDPRSADLTVRQAQLAEAQRRLQRSLDMQPLALASRQAEVRRLEADLALAQSDLRRTQALVQDEVLPPREQDFQESVEAQAREALQLARTLLDQETRDRELAIQEARAAVRTAEANVGAATAQLELSEIRAPVDGTVFDILLFGGESTQSATLLRLGEVERMYAVAEMHETDARFVRAGQTATVTSPALPSQLTGTVEAVSQLVHKNDVLDVDPVADTDSRVIEARIRVEPADVAASFVHLQVDVDIKVGQASASASSQPNGPAAERP